MDRREIIKTLYYSGIVSAMIFAEIKNKNNRTIHEIIVDLVINNILLYICMDFFKKYYYGYYVDVD